MTSSYTPLRQVPANNGFKKGDVLVVFGELFARGYANGIVDEAERAGVTVVRSTVGRRDETGKLRSLTAEESANIPQPFINVPLEAGFDLEPANDGTTPVAQLSGVKLSEWENAKLDFARLEESRKNGVERFRNSVTEYLNQLDGLIPKGANVIFAHTMAGGVPRAKILMPTMNWVFKGTGDRHLSSEKFWNSDLGRFTSMSFDEVSAETFRHLVELSQGIRDRVQNEGGSVRYLAYGYHGTEVLIRGEYRWQSYAPYLQGWAKRKLEDHAREAWNKGIKATVYNCPEILTNSSSIFVGVEVPLYPLLTALKLEAAHQPNTQEVLAKCQALLKPGVTFEQIQELTDKALTSEPIMRHCVFEKWPQHNSKDQMETLIAASNNLIELHQDPKNLITFVLSEEIFRATGHIMYNDAWKPQAPVLWLGHDVLAKALATGKTL